MGSTFMLIVAALYFCAFVAYLFEKNWPAALMAVCWGVGNLAAVWLASKTNVVQIIKSLI